ncbi:unnamed protein product, partial [Closterium sp. NIES-64]
MWVPTHVDWPSHVVQEPSLCSSCSSTDESQTSILHDRRSPEDPRYSVPHCSVESHVVRLQTLPLFDFSRPLWQVHLLPTCEHIPRSTAVFRIHHVIGDGTSLMCLLSSQSRPSKSETRGDSAIGDGISYGSKEADNSTVIGGAEGNNESASEGDEVESLTGSVVGSDLAESSAKVVAAAAAAAAAATSAVAAWTSTISYRCSYMVHLATMAWRCTIATVAHLIEFLLTILFLSDHPCTPVRSAMPFSRLRKQDQRTLPRSFAVTEGIEMERVARTVNDLMAIIAAGIESCVQVRSSVPRGSTSSTAALPSVTNSHVIEMPAATKHTGGAKEMRRVQRMRAECRQKKVSWEAHLTNLYARLALALLGRKVMAWLFARVSQQTSITVSNIAGPKGKLTLSGHVVSALTITTVGQHQ